jgi:uncharacterized protein (DUF2236 family)
MTATPDINDARFGITDYIDESALLLAAGSAVINQLALRGVGLGVAEHSNTFERPLDRLRTTLTYVYVMTMGTEEEREAITRMVNKAHVPIKGEGYTAFDPYLQLWVAATLAEGGEHMYEMTFGPMDDATKERCYQESRIMGTALQVTEDMWPATRAEFTAYWERMQGELSPDPKVQRYASQLLKTQKGFRYLAPVIWLQSLMTRGNLTQQVREVLALEWSRRDQKLYDGFWRVFRVVYPRIPRRIRTAHAHWVMRDMRKRMETSRHVI